MVLLPLNQTHFKKANIMKISIINELNGFTLDNEYSIQRDSADLLYVNDNNCKRYELSDLLDDEVAMLTGDTIHKAINKQLRSLDDDSLLNIYNEYADENSYERIYYLDEDTINSLYASCKPYDLLNSLHGDFNFSHDFFYHDGNNNLCSTNYLINFDSPVNINDLARWIIKEDKITLYNLDVIELLEWQNV